MGNSKSKSAEAPKSPDVPVTYAQAPDIVDEDSPTAKMEKYGKFREQLFSFSLGEAAYDYAERMYRENPESPEIMALLAETAALYDSHKVKGDKTRGHWVDRLDLLQRGIDISRKCNRDHPDYPPCYRTYMMCAVRAADSEYHSQQFRGFGDQFHYAGVMKRGEKALTMLQDPQVYNALGALNARAAAQIYTPHRWIGWYYGVPSRDECFARAVKYHRRACELEPLNMEFACRLAMAYYQMGNTVEARKGYVRVRDVMEVQSLDDHRWQTVAHTQLSTGFQKNRWNVPFA